MPDQNAPSDGSKKTSSNKIIIIVVVVVLVLGVGSWLMRRGTEKAVETGIENAIGSATNSSVDIDLNDQTMTITDTETNSTLTTGQKTIPDNFDDDLPIYPGAEIQSTLTTGEDNNATVYWTTNDSVSDVASYYQTELASNGWTVNSTATSSDFSTMVISKGNRQGSIVIGGDGTQTSLTVAVLDAATE